MFAGPLGEYIDQWTWSMVDHRRRSHGPWPSPRSLWIQCTGHAFWHGMVRVSMAGDIVVGMFLDSPFTYPRSDIDSMLIGWLSGGGDAHQRRIIPRCFGWSGRIRRFSCLSTSRNTIVLGQPEASSMLHHASWCNQLPIVATVFNHTLAPFQTSCTWNCEQLQGVSATFERGTSLYSFICNTQSYWIRERFVSLSYVGYK